MGGLKGLKFFSRFPWKAFAHEQGANVCMSRLEVPACTARTGLPPDQWWGGWGGGALKGPEVEAEADCRESQHVHQEDAGCHVKVEGWREDRYRELVRKGARLSGAF